ncbi:MAG: hypothetical protein Q8O30_06870 [Candidatus Omnitrophota bacterium]|nr:hypothetical protein [Candidatus Omnitrophota bacterium]
MEALSACLPAGRDFPDEIVGTSCSARSGYRKPETCARGASLSDKLNGIVN